MHSEIDNLRSELAGIAAKQERIIRKILDVPELNELLQLAVESKAVINAYPEDIRPKAKKDLRASHTLQGRFEFVLGSVIGGRRGQNALPEHFDDEEWDDNDDNDD